MQRSCQYSPMVISSGSWPKARDPKYKRQKLTFFVGWLDVPLGVGWEARSPEESSELSRFFTSRGIGSGCLLDSSLGKCFGLVPIGGDLREYPGPARKTTSLKSPGNACSSLKMWGIDQHRSILIQIHVSNVLVTWGWPVLWVIGLSGSVEGWCQELLHLKGGVGVSNPL